MRTKEQIREYHREYYKKNSTLVKERARRYSIKNRDRLRVAAKRWRDRNREKLRLYQAESRNKHRERNRGYQRAWYGKAENRTKQLGANKELRDRWRKEALEIYGNACACCGEREEKFLSFDHVKGTEHKKKVGRGMVFLRWLKAHGWPKEFCQILCHNCNMAKGAYGACPHTQA